MFFTLATYAQKRPGKIMQWNIAAELPSTDGHTRAHGLAGPVTGVHGDKLIVGGGANFPSGMPWHGGIKHYYKQLFVFEKNGARFILLKDKVALPFNLAYAANCSSGSGIVVAGGENETGISKKVFLLQWNERNSEVAIKELPELPFAVTNAAMVADHNRVYLAGGETTEGVSRQFLLLDLDKIKNGWEKLPPLPNVVSHTVLVLQNGKTGKKIYAAGGRRKNETGLSELYSSLFEFDLPTNTWNRKRSLPYALSAGTGVAAGNHLLLFGGDKGVTFQKTEQLIAAISRETNGAKKDSLFQAKIELQSSHPGFSNEILVYDVTRDEWTVAGHIPFETPVTTTAIQWNGSVIIPSGEIKAGIRTPNILIGKIIDKD